MPSLRNLVPEFLFPSSRQFPFDAVCGEIVRALAVRNFTVPGMVVELDTYGSGQQKMRIVSTVRSEDYEWSLRFHRPQGIMPGGRWNDTAAVGDLIIPRMKLSVYEDESGPSLVLYVGDDWTRDRQAFHRSLHVNSKLDGKPRTYLTYRPSELHYLGRRAYSMVANNDLGREYDAEGDEPKKFVMQGLFEMFRQYLVTNVLHVISAHPETPDMTPAPPTPTPWPERLGVLNIGSLFCLADHNEARRIREGQRPQGELLPADQYAFAQNYRLVSLGVPQEGEPFPEAAYDGFVWCGIFRDMPAFAKITVPGQYRTGRESDLVLVTPTHADDVYVADQQAYDTKRAELSKKLEQEGRDRFTDAEVNEQLRARARTLIPAVDYQPGMYQNPIFLFRRELDFDEVKLVGKEN